MPPAHPHNPYERVIKREARRREFEKMAAAKYRGSSSYEGHSHMISPSSRHSHSPNTPTYPIPKPPIPGEKLINSDTHQYGGPSPKDPRSLLPTPRAARVPPSPFIPKFKKVLAVQPMKLSKSPLLPEPKLAAQPLLPSPKQKAPLLSPSPANKKKGLLPSPKSLLPEPKGLLPNPYGVLPNSGDDMSSHVKGKLDKNDWDIISNPTAPIKKRKSEHIGSSAYDSGSRSKHCRSSSSESHHHSRRNSRSHRDSGDNSKSRTASDKGVSLFLLIDVIELSSGLTSVCFQILLKMA